MIVRPQPIASAGRCQPDSAGRWPGYPQVRVAFSPAPRDSASKRNPACKAVLAGLANHVSPEGKNAYPVVRRLARYTELSERSVRTALDRLEAGAIIRLCDPPAAAGPGSAERQPR